MIPSTAFSTYHAAFNPTPTVQISRPETPKKKALPKRKILEEKNTGTEWPRSVQTMTVTLITEVFKDDGKWMTAALRIKEEPGHLLEFYAYHLGIDFEKPDERTPEWEEGHLRSLCYLLKLRQNNDCRRYPHSYANPGPDHRSLPITRRAIMELHGDMNLTIHAIISSEERWDLAAQVLMRRAEFYGDLNNPAAYKNKALEQVLDGLFRGDAGSRPLKLPIDSRDDIVEGVISMCATFGGGLSGKYQAGKKDSDLAEDHIDVFKPDKKYHF